MSDKETLWEDSGFDCNHCGGEIHKRIDRELGHHKTTSYQCRQCHCQWSLHGALLTVGNRPICQQSDMRTRSGPRTAVKPSPPVTAPAATTRKLARIDLSQILNRIIVVLAVIVGFLFLLRFAGAVLFRFFIPGFILGVIAYLIYRMGKQQEWW